MALSGRRFKFRSNPVRSMPDVTSNFEQLEPMLPYNTPAVAYRSATQGFADKVLTQLKVDTALPGGLGGDPFGLFDLTKGWYRVPASGWYQVGLSVLLELPIGTAAVVMPLIYVNTTRTMDGGHFGATSAVEAFAGGSISGLVYAKRGAHIEGWVYQASGAERKSLAAFSSSNQLSVVRVA